MEAFQHVPPALQRPLWRLRVIVMSKQGKNVIGTGSIPSHVVVELTACFAPVPANATERFFYFVSFHIKGHSYHIFLALYVISFSSHLMNSFTFCPTCPVLDGVQKMIAGEGKKDFSLQARVYSILARASKSVSMPQEGTELLMLFRCLLALTTASVLRQPSLSQSIYF
jgi:hypothetical protein